MCYVSGMERLRRAIRSISDNDDEIAPLLMASLNQDITYRDLRELFGKEDISELLLIANEKRFIMPRGENLSWNSSDRFFRLEDEIYYTIPNVVKFAVMQALESGVWDINHAIHAYFKQIEEPLWDTMPAFFNALKQHAKYRKITSDDIKAIADSFGIGDKTGALIAELKGSGLISPSVKVGVGAAYEVHPLF